MDSLSKWGGLVFVQDRKPEFVITSSKLQELIDKKIVDPPFVTEEDISERTKGDFLAKFLALLQTTWFVVQCVGRWAAKLIITELEVVTLAFATLNFITYLLWWHKPQNVQMAIRIFKRSDATPLVMQPLVEEQTVSGDVEKAKGWLSWVTKLATLLSIYFKRLPRVFAPLPKMAFTDEVPPGSTRVPMFYADHMSAEKPGIWSTPLAIGAIFGVTHFLSWNSSFPSFTERFSWCMSTVIITFLPLSSAIGTGLYQLLGGRPMKRVFKLTINGLAVVFGGIGFNGLPLYICARVALLVVAFTTLRSLPPAALEELDWHSLLPHL